MLPHIPAIAAPRKQLHPQRQSDSQRHRQRRRHQPSFRHKPYTDLLPPPILPPIPVTAIQVATPCAKRKAVSRASPAITPRQPSVMLTKLPTVLPNVSTLKSVAISPSLWVEECRRGVAKPLPDPRLAIAALEDCLSLESKSLTAGDSAAIEIRNVLETALNICGIELDDMSSWKAPDWVRDDCFAKHEAQVGTLEQALSSRLTSFGDAPLTIAACQQVFGVMRMHLGHPIDALFHFRAALTRRLEHLGDDDKLTASSAASVGAALHALKQFDQALPFLEQALSIRVRTLGLAHNHVACDRMRLAASLEQSSRKSEAEGHRHFENWKPPLLTQPSSKRTKICDRGVSLSLLLHLASIVDPKWSSEDVVTKLVQPATQADYCSYTDLLPAELVSRPTYFVSHVWKDNFASLVQRCEEYCRAVGLSDPSQVFLWLDLFAVLQHEGPQQKDDLVHLAEAVREAQGTIIVADGSGNVFSRIWCIFEMHTAQSCSLKSSLLFPNDIDSDQLQALWRNLDVSKAQAQRESDRQRILTDFEQSPINSLQLTRHLKQAVIAGVEAQLTATRQRLPPTLQQPIRSTEQVAAFTKAQASMLWDALIRCGRLLRAAANYARALEVLRETRFLSDRLPAFFYSQSCAEIGDVLLDCGERHEAESMFQASLDARQQADYKYSDQQAARAKMSLLSLRASDAAGIKTMVDSIAAYLDLSLPMVLDRESRDSLKFLLNILRHTGPMSQEKASAVRSTAVNLFSKVGLSIDTIPFWYSTAVVLNNADCLNEAQLMIDALLPRVELELGENHPMLANVLITRGSICACKDDTLSTAEDSFNRALQIHLHTLGDSHATTAESALSLGRFLRRQNRQEEALPVLQQSLDIATRCYGDSHAKVADIAEAVARTLEALGRFSEALPLWERAFQISLVHDQASSANRASGLAGVLSSLGRMEDALSFAERAVLLGSENQLAQSLNEESLARLLVRLNRLSDALPHRRSCLSRSVALLRGNPSSHELLARTSSLASSLAMTLSQLGQLDEALNYYEQAIELAEQIGKTREDVAVHEISLALTFVSADRDAEAVPHFEKALSIRHTCLGDGHMDTARAAEMLGSAHSRLDHYNEAVQAWEHARNMYYKAGVSPLKLADLDNTISVTYSLDLKRPAEALYWARSSLAQYQLGADVPKDAFVRPENWLAHTLEVMKEPLEALPHRQRVLTLHQEANSAPPVVASAHERVFDCYFSLNRDEEGRIHAEQALVIRVQSQGELHLDTAGSHGNVGLALKRIGRLDEALTHFEQGLVIRQQLLPVGHERIAVSHFNIASVLHLLGRSSEARSHADMSLTIRNKLFGHLESHAQLLESRQQVNDIEQSLK